VAVLQVTSAPLRVTVVMPQEAAVILIVHTHLVAISVALNLMTTIVTIMVALDAVLCPVAHTSRGGRWQG
jgi:hypothetical protein